MKIYFSAKLFFFQELRLILIQIDRIYDQIVFFKTFYFYLYIIKRCSFEVSFRMTKAKLFDF
ncbi:hypothetical protein C1634_012025 [Chryseobacterium viscerum]|uniref:Uncharacterized protein n=1 Tax=Chryseobacterium viscerum TaxID=1037377 RepID=A0A316WQH9_9FLAO|nr:hypothetical protein C1634_012025 [Chryseobacterium viscerum]